MSEPGKRRRLEEKRAHLVDALKFRQWLTEVLTRRGFDDDEASAAAQWAATTASFEVETHGARKLLSLLDHEFAHGETCVPRAQHETLISLPSLEVWDGHKKLGPAIASLAQARSVEMAKGAGMGMVFVRNCNHFGWGPAYALEHLTDDLLLGNLTQGAIPIVTPLGGSTATMGSNAVAVACATGVEGDPTFLWDTGTAAMSWGEVQKLRLENTPLRPGAAVDARGEPTVQASDAASLLPAGTIGNALGMLIELLSANVGAGDPRARSVPPEEVPAGEPTTCVFVFFAIHLAAFEALSFPSGRSRMENVARMVTSILKGNGDARMVGLRKWRAKERSEEHGGLLFAPESIAAFRAEASARGVPFCDAPETGVAFEPVEVASK